MNLPESEKPSGLPYALGAYLIWGLFPLYLLFLRDVPPFEFVGWRIVLTVPVCLAIVAVTRQGKALRLAMGSPKVLASLTVSALLIGANWLIYVVAIQSNHVFAASLGYYINPLVNVLAGTLFLGERLSRPQWCAVALAAAGVSLLAGGAIEMLGIALALAFSFASYGLARRLAPVGALLGLTIETLMLVIPALGVIAWYAGQPGGVSFGKNLQTDMLLPFSGAITAAGLLLFATAARRMEYSTLGFVQYLTPTMAFFLGLFVFHEPLRPIQLACFVAIWIAMAIFSWDLWSRRRNPPL
jgi:chloramphenicol-sensitive protein RarD